MDKKLLLFTVIVVIIIIFLLTNKYNKLNNKKEPFLSGSFYSTFYGYRRAGLPSDYYYPFRYKYGFYLYPPYMRDYDLWRYRYRY